MSKTVVIELTDEQSAQARDLIVDMPEGGACFAQVYGDAMRVRVFDTATARRVAEAIGTASGAEGLHNSAFDAHEAALKAGRLN